jgi:hypothetical protein
VRGVAQSVSTAVRAPCCARWLRPSCSPNSQSRGKRRCGSHHGGVLGVSPCRVACMGARFKQSGACMHLSGPSANCGVPDAQVVCCPGGQPGRGLGGWGASGWRSPHLLSSASLVAPSAGLRLVPGRHGPSSCLDRVLWECSRSGRSHVDRHEAASLLRRTASSYCGPAELNWISPGGTAFPCSLQVKLHAGILPRRRHSFFVACSMPCRFLCPE